MTFTLYKPLPGHDEDAPPYAGGSMLIVCDGLGGSGMNKHTLSDGTERTSAYLGSRVVMDAVKEYCSDNFDAFWTSEDGLTACLGGLKAHLKTRLDAFVQENQLTCYMRGKSIHMLPTTLAAILYRLRPDQTADVLVISAGDSRAYALNDRDGLHQISRDDVREDQDAFTNNSAMLNNISQDADFHLNYRQLNVCCPCVLFVCSDGCFDDLDLPMRLEFLMEYALLKSITLGDGFAGSMSEQLSELLDQYGTKDDCTMAGAILGCDDPVGLQNQFLERLDTVSQSYIQRYETLREAEIEEKRRTEDEIEALARQIDGVNAACGERLRDYLKEYLARELTGTQTADDPFRGLTGDVLASFPRWNEYQKRIGEMDSSRAEEQRAADALILSTRRDILRIWRAKRFDDAFSRVRNDDVGRRFAAIASFGKASQDPLYNDIQHEYDAVQAAIRAAKQEFLGASERFSDMFRSYTDEVKSGRSLHVSSEHLEILFDTFLERRDQLESAREESVARLNRFRQNYVDTPASEEEFRAACDYLFSRENAVPEYRELLSEYDRVATSRTGLRGLTPEEKLAEFEKLYNEHPDEWTEHFGHFFDLSEHIWGDLTRGLRDLTIRKAGLEATMQTASRRAYGVWEEYKLTYEWFHKGLGGKV